MDTISLFPGTAPGTPVPRVGIRVNGTDLREIVRRVLAPDEPDPLHGWIPLALLIPPSRYWTGSPESGWARGNRAAVLACSCGDFRCGGLVAEIAVGKHVVVWRDLAGVAGGVIAALGPYCFDRDDHTARVAQTAGPGRAPRGRRSR